MENLEIVLNRFNELNIDINNSELSYIEHLEPGTYRLKERPTAEFLSKTPYFKNCNAEIGIICINNRWIIVLGEEGKHEMVLPPELKAISHDGYFQIFMHSHPFVADDDDLGQPSIQDISSCNSTIDGCQYIISHTGLTEIQNTSLPRIELLGKSPKLWRKHIVEDLNLNEKEFYEIGEWQLVKKFCEKFFNVYMED